MAKKAYSATKTDKTAVDPIPAPRKGLLESQCFCDNCKISFYRVKSAQKKQNFCSVKCRGEFVKIDRTCKTCGKLFKSYKSALNGKTNASGNFCSRPCYETHLCRTERTTGRGSQWKRQRDLAVKRVPFCGRCGTGNNLQVHHIIPFRLTKNNSQENLIPLCVKCHKEIECMTNDLEADGLDEKTLRLILKSMQIETFQMIKAANA